MKKAVGQQDFVIELDRSKKQNKKKAKNLSNKEENIRAEIWNTNATFSIVSIVRWLSFLYFWLLYIEVENIFGK